MNQSKQLPYLLVLLPVVLWPLAFASDWIPWVPQSVFSGIPRTWWWSFATTVFLLEWAVFLYLKTGLKRLNETWTSINLDWHWFYRNRKWLIPYVAIFVICAIVMPGVLYGGNIPDQGQIIPVTPVRWTERLFFVLLSITAGVCEEITFRGVGITYLTRLTKSPWLAAIITSLCFVFIHGSFVNWFWFAQYFIIGMLFAMGIILAKRPRLEILIVIHFTVDASLAAFIP